MDSAGDRSDLGAWLDYQIEELHMTLVELAEAVQVTPATLWNWRTGKHQPRKTQKRALEDALHWRRGSIDDIAKGLPPTIVPVDERLSADDPPARHEGPVRVPDGLLDASRAELNRAADWVAAWRGEEEAENFMDWATSLRTRHRNPSSDVTERNVI